LGILDDLLRSYPLEQRRSLPRADRGSGGFRGAGDLRLELRDGRGDRRSLLSSRSLSCHQPSL